MKLFYHGPRPNPGSHLGRAGELRIVSLAGLWDKVREAMRDGGILRLAHKPTLAYLRAASEGSEPQCLLCGVVLVAETAPLSMMVFVLPYQPKRDPVAVSFFGISAPSRSARRTTRRARAHSSPAPPLTAQRSWDRP